MACRAPRRLRRLAPGLPRGLQIVVLSAFLKILSNAAFGCRPICKQERAEAEHERASVNSAEWS